MAWISFQLIYLILFLRNRILFKRLCTVDRVFLNDSHEGSLNKSSLYHSLEPVALLLLKRVTVDQQAMRVVTISFFPFISRYLISNESFG